MTVPAVDEADACRFAVQLVHAELGTVPPWKACRRESVERTTATRTSAPPRLQVVSANRQLSLDERLAA